MKTYNIIHACNHVVRYRLPGRLAAPEIDRIALALQRRLCSDCSARIRDAYLTAREYAHQTGLPPLSSAHNVLLRHAEICRCIALSELSDANSRWALLMRGLGDYIRVYGEPDCEPSDIDIPAAHESVLITVFDYTDTGYWLGTSKGGWFDRFAEHYFLHFQKVIPPRQG